jgi:hypothetical protein
MLFQLCQMTRDFYRNLYTSEGTSGMDEVLASVPVSVTSVMNESLTAPFEDGEIKQALFQMYPLKAPGPDEFLAHFFSETLGCVWDRGDQGSPENFERGGKSERD